MTEPQGMTVVVPTLNRGGFLPDCLRDLVAQRHRPLEILVVDQSADVPGQVARLAELHPDVIRYHRVSFRGLPEARNHGWQHATHEAIIFVDDDIRCGPEFVSEHLRALTLPRVGVVAGGIDEANKPADVGPPTGLYKAWTSTPMTGFGAWKEGDVDHAKGCNFSVWKRALVEVGGVDERLNVGAALYEEADLCLRIKRAGYRIYFNGKARLTHLAAADGGCRVGQVRSYVFAMAHNRSLMIRRHGRWYHAPVALGRLAALGFSYARHYRTPRAIAACVSGSLQGLLAGRKPPLCTARVPGRWA